MEDTKKVSGSRKARRRRPVRRRAMTDAQKLERHHFHQEAARQRKKRLYLLMAGVGIGFVLAEWANDPDAFADFFKLDDTGKAAVMQALAHFQNMMPNGAEPPPPPEANEDVVRAAIKAAAESAVVGGGTLSDFIESLKGFSDEELAWATECYNKANDIHAANTRPTGNA